MSLTEIQFCAGLIGKPWVSGACGPDAFDCWGLVCYIYKIRRGVDLTPYPGVKESGLIQSLRNAEREALRAWEVSPVPVHFGAVGMSKGERVEHVGLWLECGGGMILHANEKSGVVCQSMGSIRTTGIQKFIFYKLKP